MYQLVLKWNNNLLKQWRLIYLYFITICHAYHQPRYPTGVEQPNSPDKQFHDCQQFQTVFQVFYFELLDGFHSLKNKNNKQGSHELDQATEWGTFGSHWSNDNPVVVQLAVSLSAHSRSALSVKFMHQSLIEIHKKYITTVLSQI